MWISGNKVCFPEYVLFVAKAELREVFYTKYRLPQVMLYYAHVNTIIHTYSIQVMNSAKAHSLQR